MLRTFSAYLTGKFPLFSSPLDFTGRVKLFYFVRVIIYSLFKFFLSQYQNLYYSVIYLTSDTLSICIHNRSNEHLFTKGIRRVVNLIIWKMIIDSREKKSYIFIFFLSLTRVEYFMIALNIFSNRILIEFYFRIEYF